MLFNSGSFNVGGKPLLRLLATTLAALLVFFILRNPQPSAQGTFLPSLLPIGGRFQGLFTSQPSLSFNAFYHQYESPQDLYVPRVNGRELATESLIGKVTIMFNGRDPTYIRALQTHEVHNRRFGYPMFVLRHQILENIWSKPAYILAILLEELRKPEGHRLKWLLYAVCPLNPLKIVD